MQLLAGFRGSGKTTVLLELREELKRQQFVVLSADVSGYHDLTADVTAESLLVALIASIGEAAEAEHKNALLAAQTSFIKRVAALFGASIALDDTVNLKALRFQLQAGAPLPERLRTTLSDPEGPLLGAFRAFFTELAASYRGAAVVLLFDGLEKIQSSIDETAAAYRRLTDFFVRYGSSLRFDGMHAVYVVPPQSLVLAPQLENVRIVPSVRIASRRPERARDDDGYRALAAVLASRFDVDAIFGGVGSETTAEIVAASGGHLRLLQRLAADVIGAALSTSGLGDPALPIEAGFARQTIERGAILKRDAARRMRSTLEKQAKSGDAGGLAPEQLDRMAVALNQEQVLAYVSGELWYDVQPLVRPVLRETALGETALGETALRESGAT